MEAEFIFVRRSLENQLRELPPLPKAAMQVIEASQDPTVSLENIGDIVSSDQALTSKILRTANSSYYGLARQIANTTQAVVILGMHQVRNVTMAAAAQGTFPARGSAHEAGLAQFWAHAFATSSTAGAIAKSRQWPAKRICELQTTGLVADMGRLFLYANFPDAFNRLIHIAKEKEISFETAEQDEMGMPHAEVGAEIAERWGFPTHVVATIRAHEETFDLGDDSDGAVICLADAAQKHHYSLLSEVSTPALPNHRCGLTAEGWNTVLGCAQEELAAAGPALGVAA